MSSLGELERATFPRLPLPKLEETLDGYLKSLQPWLEEEERLNGKDKVEAMALLRRWADDFASGIGQTLQTKLEGEQDTH